MRILYLGLNVPHMHNTKSMYGQFVEEIHRNGHEVCVVAPAYDSKLTGLQIEGGIKVIRVSTLPLFKVGFIKKGIANILLPLQYKRALKRCKLPLQFDVVIMPTPPITLISVASWFKKKYNSKVYLILRDIFPQNAVDLKIFSRNSIFYYYFRRIEKRMYKLSDGIGCMSQANIDYVIKHNPEIPASKLHLLPNWSKLYEERKISRLTSDFKTKYRLEDKFIVLFGGNMGRPQKLENILNLAKNCEDYQNIQFVFVGNGTEKKRMEGIAADNKLNNVLFIDGLPMDEYLKVLNASDVGLISLSEDFTIPNFPSKVLSYFHLKKPVLASIDANTDFGKMLDETKSGLWSQAGDIIALKKNLIKLFNDKELREQLGLNGYNHMVNNLLLHHSYQRFYEAFLKNLE